MKALKKIVSFYNKTEIIVTIIHADNEFFSIEEEMEEDSELEFNFAALDEQFPDIERDNIELQERF